MHLQFFLCQVLCLVLQAFVSLRICATLFCAQAISLSCIPLYHTDAAHKLNMPVHHLVVAWPPPIHQPVLFFQLLPPGVHRAGHLPRSQPIAVTPTLSTASMNFLCGFHLFLLHCSSIHSILCPKYSWSVLYTSKPAESPLSLFLIQLSKFDNLIFIQRMMVYNPYRGACYIWRHLYLSLWGKPSLRRCEDSRAGTENWAHLWMNENSSASLPVPTCRLCFKNPETRSIWTVQPCCVFTLLMHEVELATPGRLLQLTSLSL